MQSGGLGINTQDNLDDVSVSTSGKSVDGNEVTDYGVSFSFDN